MSTVIGFSPRGVPARVLIAQLVRFFFGTLLGLAVDLGIFVLCVSMGVAPGLANAVSSTCAVVVTYVVSVGFAFGVSPKARSFLLYVLWYAFSIVLFSLVIQLVHDAVGLSDLWAKIAVLPFSFVANFIASRAILVTPARGVPDEGAEA